MDRDVTIPNHGLPFYFNSEVFVRCYSCVMPVSEMSAMCMMYSCMLCQWCYTVNKCLNVRSGSNLSGLFYPLLTLPKLTQVRRTQLTRPSTSGWYYPSVPGGSETQLHCVTIIWGETYLWHISPYTAISSHLHAILLYLLYLKHVFLYFTAVTGVRVKLGCSIVIWINLNFNL